jgi:hypothetical protein
MALGAMALTYLSPISQATVPTPPNRPNLGPAPGIHPFRLNCDLEASRWEVNLRARYRTSTNSTSALAPVLLPIANRWIDELKPVRNEICTAIAAANAAPTETRPIPATGAQCDAFQEMANAFNSSSQPSQNLISQFESRVARLMEKFYESRTAYQNGTNTTPVNASQRQNLMVGVWGGPATGRDFNADRSRRSVLGKDIMGMQDELKRARDLVTANNNQINVLNARRGACGPMTTMGRTTTTVTPPAGQTEVTPPSGPGSTPSVQQPGGDGSPGGRPWGVAQEIAGQPPGTNSGDGANAGQLLGPNTGLWVAGGVLAVGAGVAGIMYHQSQKDKESKAAAALDAQARASAQQQNSGNSQTGTSTSTNTSTTGSGAVSEANGYRYTVSTLPGGVIRRDVTINPIEVRFFNPNGSQSDVSGLLVRVGCTQVCSLQGITEKRTVNGSVDFTDLRFIEEETGMQLRVSPVDFNSVVSPGSFNVRN